MKKVSREDALAWAVESLPVWPNINDWARSDFNEPQGWMITSRPGHHLVSMTANGEYSIDVSNWMKAKNITRPTREMALSWLIKHLPKWPINECTDAPIGWDWVRLVNPNSVTLVAEGCFSIQKSDWEKEKKEWDLSRAQECGEDLSGGSLTFDPSGYIGSEFRAEVEVLLGGVPTVAFIDGTQQFIDIVDGHAFVYSPRLPPNELERFCEVNIMQYQQFNEDNIEQIDNFERVCMKPFW